MQSKNTTVLHKRDCAVCGKLWHEMIIMFPLYYRGTGHGSVVKTQLSFVPKAGIHSYTYKCKLCQI